MQRVLMAVGLLGALTGQGRAVAGPQWIVVTAPAYRDAIQLLCEEREAQGFKVRVVNSADILSAREISGGDPARLRDHLHKLCHDHDGRSMILLVGAVQAGPGANATQTVVPCLTGTVGRMKGQPSDNGYGCEQGSRLPKVAVGRLPARSVAEARAMVEKTLRFEKDSRSGTWRRKLVILAGIPAYNPVVDRLVESMAFARLERLSPVWMGRAIYTSSSSRFCLPDDRLHGKALEYVEAGEAFTLYLGHSSPEGLYAGRAHFLDWTDWSLLRIRRGAGILLTFGCNGCQLSGKDGEGYGVAAARNPWGPVAVIGSHGICFAAMVQLAADGLFESAFASGPPRLLGDLWLDIKKNLAHGHLSSLTYNILDGVDGDSSIPQPIQRQEHLEMFMLLGDPALPLPVLPSDIELEAEPALRAGSRLKVSGTLPVRLWGAKVEVRLERTVSSIPQALQAVTTEGGADGAERRNKVLLANHERANNFVLAEQQCKAHGKKFEVVLQAPGSLPWPQVIVRAIASKDGKEGMAVLKLEVVPAQRRMP